jgi:hypothetical protein
MPENTQITAEMVERVADAMERAEVGYHLRLVKLVDDVHTYALTYDDAEPLEFNCTEDAYAHIATKKREVQARAALESALADHVVVPREPTEAMIREGEEVYCAAAKDNCATVYRAMISAALPREG